MTEALTHYEQQLGFQVVMTMSESDYAIVERDGVALHLFADESEGHSPGSLHIFASSLEDLYEELLARGAKITGAIVHQPWGTRDFRVMDSSGNVIKFTESASNVAPSQPLNQV